MEAPEMEVHIRVQPPLHRLRVNGRNTVTVDGMLNVVNPDDRSTVREVGKRGGKG
jgi:hypothetical protein